MRNIRFQTSKLYNSLGIDKSILYSVFGKIVQAGGGVLTVVFIALFLSKAEQGYYYTFGSIIAIQIFFELGLSTIITQYVAHEAANLNWKEGLLDGPAENLSRLSSLLRLVVKWFSYVCILLFVSLTIAGSYFFNTFNSESEINWVFPWLLLAIGTAVSLLVSPLLAYTEGLGKVKEIAKLRLIQQSVYSLLVFSSLYFGAKLLASGIALNLSIIVMIVLFLKYFKPVLVSIWNQSGLFKISYRNEIFPYQWRIALSWISGYFIFQLFNPVIFATEGSVAAGRMGMTLAVLNGLTGVSMTWINTKVPAFSTFIAKKEYQSLDDVFNRTLKQVALISFGGITFFIITICLLMKIQPNIAERFVDVVSLTALSIATVFNILINALATYLRCHKKEPYLILSLVMAILTAASTYVFGKMYGIRGISIGYFVIITFISFSYATYIFVEKKKEWHI